MRKRMFRFILAILFSVVLVGVVAIFNTPSSNLIILKDRYIEWESKQSGVCCLITIKETVTLSDGKIQRKLEGRYCSIDRKAPSCDKVSKENFNLTYFIQNSNIYFPVERPLFTVVESNSDSYYWKISPYRELTGSENKTIFVNKAAKKYGLVMKGDGLKQPKYEFEIISGNRCGPNILRTLGNPPDLVFSDKCVLVRSVIRKSTCDVVPDSILGRFLKINTCVRRKLVADYVE